MQHAVMHHIFLLFPFQAPHNGRALEDETTLLWALGGGGSTVVVVEMEVRTVCLHMPVGYCSLGEERDSSRDHQGDSLVAGPAMDAHGLLAKWHCLKDPFFILALTFMSCST
jgi:hypothetical protein